MNYIRYINQLPYDIIVNHIIPYTYKSQPIHLLEDIKNYDLIKKELLDSKYNTKLIKHEILAVFYTDTNILKNVLERSFIFKQTLKTKNMNIHSYTNDKKFAILFGLFRPIERQLFLQHITQDNGIWFV
uniref:Uncharacterized protein n=1 Tax=viral metagenome TaxID=1070528 RepID=A0A6C0D8T8_9ZZZZ